MALIQHGIFPRSMFDMDQWFKPAQLGGVSTLDLFDPFDELDHTISRNLEWLNKPDFLAPFPLMPRVPQKYRITVDVAGYQPKSIKTEVKGLKLFVTGREEFRQESGDFSVKEFKKTYDLPEASETDKLVSFVTGNSQLVIEVPLRETQQNLNEDLFPRIVDAPNGGKQVALSVSIPQNIDPSKIHVNIKDRDLIIKAQDRVEKPDGVSTFHYYKRTTLPENTDFDAVKCDWADNRLQLSAPLRLDFKSHRSVPIEHKKPASINAAPAAPAKQ